MNFPFYIARKYFVAKKSQHAINIISLISMIGVAVGTMGLIIVLSVFNGFGDLVVSLYNSFDPDISITLKEGKVFNFDQQAFQEIKKMKGVHFVTPVLEENALVKYKERQYIATIKGVGEQFGKMSGVDSMLVDGTMKLKEGNINFAIVGRAIAEAMQVNISDYLNALDIYVPKRGVLTMNPEDAFNHELIVPSGIFAIQQDFDAKYLIVPISFARNLLGYSNEVSSVELGLQKGADLEVVKKQIALILGDKFTIKDRAQQHELLYKIMKSEKWAVYLILSFILLIATFNVISSLTMLIIDKKKDIKTLASLGANNVQVRRVFLLEGTLISMTGAVIGLLIGFIVCFLQEKFGLISMGGGFVVDAYPVQMQLMDFLYVFLTVMVIGLFAAWYPARRLVKEYMESKL